MNWLIYGGVRVPPTVSRTGEAAAPIDVCPHVRQRAICQAVSLGEGKRKFGAPHCRRQREADPAAPQPTEAPAGLDEAVALFGRTRRHWTVCSIQLHSRGKMTRFFVEISRLQQDRTEELYYAQGPMAVEAMQNVIAGVPEASRQPDAPPAEGKAD